MHRQTLLKAVASQFTTNSPTPSQFAACWHFKPLPGWLDVGKRGSSRVQGQTGTALLTFHVTEVWCDSERWHARLHSQAVAAPVQHELLELHSGCLQCLQRSQGTARAQGAASVPCWNRLCSVCPGWHVLPCCSLTLGDDRPSQAREARRDHALPKDAHWDCGTPAGAVLLQLSGEDTKTSSGSQDLPQSDCRARGLNFNSLSSSGGCFSLFSSSEEVLKCWLGFLDF